jgi:hypothetical protein
MLAIPSSIPVGDGIIEPAPGIGDDPLAGIAEAIGLGAMEPSAKTLPRIALIVMLSPHVVDPGIARKECRERAHGGRWLHPDRAVPADGRSGDYRGGGGPRLLCMERGESAPNVRASHAGAAGTERSGTSPRISSGASKAARSRTDQLVSA